MKLITRLIVAAITLTGGAPTRGLAGVWVSLDRMELGQVRCVTEKHTCYYAPEVTLTIHWGTVDNDRRWSLARIYFRDEDNRLPDHWSNGLVLENLVKCPGGGLSPMTLGGMNKCHVDAGIMETTIKTKDILWNNSSSLAIRDGTRTLRMCGKLQTGRVWEPATCQDVPLRFTPTKCVVSLNKVEIIVDDEGVRSKDVGRGLVYMYALHVNCTGGYTTTVRLSASLKIQVDDSSESREDVGAGFGKPNELRVPGGMAGVPVKVQTKTTRGGMVELGQYASSGMITVLIE